MHLLLLFLLSVPTTSKAGTDAQFPPSEKCASCHSRIPARTGTASVGQVALWRGSMMAHSSQDAFWKAKVQEEISLTPSAAIAIEDKCLRCHAPSEQYPLRAKGGMRIRDLHADEEGVTCTVCHQISAGNLATPASFTGGFEINQDSEIYGPHEDPFRMPMLHHTGLIATASQHILQSALCGTCHTVITPTLDRDGRVVGELVEQAPFLEWLSSDYSRSGRSCQSCHLPVLRERSGATDAQYIAHRPPGGWFPPTRPRSPFGLHFFAGGNAQMLRLLSRSDRDNESALHATADRAEKNLRSALALRATAGVETRMLRVTVDVLNRTGHKLPTGFPSRRIWLHVTAFSADGRRIFESGGLDGQTGRLIADQFQPHRAVISKPEQVLIYQAVMADREDRPTSSLLRGASYLKDNRLLPVGFDAGSEPRVRPAGVSTDEGFRPGFHRVLYEIPIARAIVPKLVQIEALYQSVDPAYIPEGSFSTLSAATAAIKMATVELSLIPQN